MRNHFNRQLIKRNPYLHSICQYICTKNISKEFPLLFNGTKSSLVYYFSFKTYHFHSYKCSLIIKMAINAFPLHKSKCIKTDTANFNEAN